MSAVAETSRAPTAQAAAAATGDLYRRYCGRIFSFCRYRLGNREEAEDATQATFLNAHRMLRRGTNPEYEAAWLYAIAGNVCRTRQRAAWRRRRVETPSDLEVVEEVVPAPEREPDELIRLSDALQAMPERQRQALLLREWQGLSYAEIARELGATQSTVQMLVFRGRKALARDLRGSAAGTVGSLVAAGKSLLLGSAAKVAATAVALTAAASVVATVAKPHHGAPHPAVTVSTPAVTAPSPKVVASPVPVVHANAPLASPRLRRSHRVVVAARVRKPVAAQTTSASPPSEHRAPISPNVDVHAPTLVTPPAAAADTPPAVTRPATVRTPVATRSPTSDGKPAAKPMRTTTRRPATVSRRDPPQSARDRTPAEHAAGPQQQSSAKSGPSQPGSPQPAPQPNTPAQADPQAPVQQDPPGTDGAAASAAAQASAAASEASSALGQAQAAVQSAASSVLPQGPPVVPGKPTG